MWYFNVVCFCCFFFSNFDWWFVWKIILGGDKDEGYVFFNYVVIEDILEIYEWVNIICNMYRLN